MRPNLIRIHPQRRDLAGIKGGQWGHNWVHGRVADVEEHLHSKGEALYRKQTKNPLDSPSVISEQMEVPRQGLVRPLLEAQDRCSEFYQIMFCVVIYKLL
jgi:hypothetical protein